jgi:hypothetical protein
MDTTAFQNTGAAAAAGEPLLSTLAADIMREHRSRTQASLDSLHHAKCAFRPS